MMYGLSQAPVLSRARGLSTLMSSRGVTTVGCLAALTEHEVTNLPLRPPKVAHTRSVLEEFARRNNLESAQSEPADVGTDVTPTTGMS